MRKAFAVLVSMMFVISTMGLAVAQAPPAKAPEATPAPAKAEKKS
jgi:hypothetical protein